MISNNVMLDALQSDHTTLEGLKMLVLTWNVNAKLEELPNLRKLFFREEEKCFGGTPEIVVLGLQEMVELSTSNVIGGKIVGNAAERVDQWRAMLLTTLKERDVTFEMVTSKNMVGLWITVFSLRSFKQHISKVQVAQLGRGVGGVLGNKGAVYARFNVKDTSVCLVCAHFAAHRENLLKRNEDFHAILTHKAFPGLLDGASSTTEYKHLSQHNTIHMTTEAARVDRLQDKIIAMKKTLMDKRIPVSPPIDLKKEQLANYTSAQDHDVIIWLGDLNYRLLGGMDNSRIYDIIDGKRSYALLNLDQLNIEKDKGTVFQGFHEGLIPFDPTYKYIPGSANYNRERCPAWCDRVLWKLKKADLDIEVFGDLDTYISDEHFSVKSGSTVNFTKVRSATVANRSETVELSSEVVGGDIVGGDVAVEAVATVVVDSLVTADSTGVTDTFVLSSTDTVVDSTTTSTIDTITIINTTVTAAGGVLSPFSPLSECSVDSNKVESSKFSDAHTSIVRSDVTVGADVVEGGVQSSGGDAVRTATVPVDPAVTAASTIVPTTSAHTTTDNATDSASAPSHTATSTDITSGTDTTTIPTTTTTSTTDTTTITITTTNDNPTTSATVDDATNSAYSSDSEEGEQAQVREQAQVNNSDSARVLGSIHEESEGSEGSGEDGSDGEGSGSSGDEESEGEGEGESSGDEEGRRSLVEGSDVDDHNTNANTAANTDPSANTTIPTTPDTPTPTGTPHTPATTTPHTTTPHTHTPHSARKSTKGPRKPKRSFRSLPPMPEIRSSVYLVPEARVTEIVELMVYNRGENIISDHKPVRALLGVKFKRVDWSGHEQHLLDHYTKKCQERPFHTKSFQMLHGHTPVSFTPRTVTLLSGFNPERTQSVEVLNHSPTHSVKFGIMSDSLPGWMRVSVNEGVIAPGQVVKIEVECCSAEADHSYIHALEEDARFAEAKLRDVWRRHIRNPDDRGNPQLSAVLQVHLCTHLSPDAAFASKINVKSFGKAMRPGDLPESALATDSATAATTDTNDGDADMFTVRMAPLSIPVLCKVSTK